VITNGEALIPSVRALTFEVFDDPSRAGAATDCTRLFAQLSPDGTGG
jgi:hypothetical protein